MNYSSKNTISQQKADGPSDFLGITQSSGLDRHAVYSRQRVDDFRHNFQGWRGNQHPKRTPA